jgi:hypothetical protein
VYCIYLFLLSIILKEKVVKKGYSEGFLGLIETAEAASVVSLKPLKSLLLLHKKNGRIETSQAHQFLTSNNYLEYLG